MTTATNIVAPKNSAELAELVRSTPRVLAVGARTKPRLSEVAEEVAVISTLGLNGIVEYEPEEFTFTALAGTTVREISKTLSAKGQYLPFDPLWFDAGATLGGTVASGMSGPGRFRYGGVRDFILGVRFVDGLGRLLRMGGKVVKNSAGFDLPKFFVGSLGRFGVLTEITFKVFPNPPARLTLKLATADVHAATRVLVETASARWETEALDLLPDGKNVLLRLAGPADAIAMLAKEILARWPGEALSSADAEAAWETIRELQWRHPNGVLIKIPITPAQVATVHEAVRPLDAKVHISGGGNVALVSFPASATGSVVDEWLTAGKFAGLTLAGKAPLWLGQRAQTEIAGSVKKALDPNHRFPNLHN